MNDRKRLPWLEVHEAYQRIQRNLTLVPNGNERLKVFSERCGIHQDKWHLQLAFLPDMAVMRLDKQLQKEIQGNERNRNTAS